MTAEAKELAVREPNWIAPSVPLPVTSHEEYVQVDEALSEVKEFQRRVTEFFSDMKDRAHKTWKSIVAKEKETLALPTEWERQCKTALDDWDRQQEELRLVEQRRLEAEARRQEEERRLAEAAALEAEAIAEGDEEKLAEAERLIEEPIETPVVVVPRQTPKVEGLSYRETWDAKVTDVGALIRHVAAEPSLQNLLLPNAIALRAMARSLKGNLSLPGVKAFSSRIVAQRRKGF